MQVDFPKRLDMLFVGEVNNVLNRRLDLRRCFDMRKVLVVLGVSHSDIVALCVGSPSQKMIVSGTPQYRWTGGGPFILGMLLVLLVLAAVCVLGHVCPGSLLLVCQIQDLGSRGPQIPTRCYHNFPAFCVLWA